jgi:putative NADH-flavin reductase
MLLTLFGATGKTGAHLLEQALAAGHHVTVLVRHPAKLTTHHERLTVMQGDAQDAAKVAEVVRGAEAVISVLGPTSNAPVMAVTHSTQNILAAMQQFGVRRLVLSAGAGVGDPRDKPQLFHQFINWLIKTLAPNVYADMVQVVALVRASAVDWTIVRAPMLTDAPAAGTRRVGYVGLGPGPRLTRADLAAFMLAQATSSEYLRQAPVLSN